MNDVEERILGPTALVWIRDVLADGPLGSLIASRLDLTRGRITTHLPRAVSAEAAHHFLGPVLLPSELEDERLQSGQSFRSLSVQTLGQALADVIRRFLREQREPLCVFEDRLAKPHDGWLARSGTTTLSLDDSVYHFLTRADVYQDRIERTVDVVLRPYPPLVGLLTHCLDDAPAGPLTPAMLEKLVEQSSHLMIGAYDGEGFLLWTRE
jgi:hypothetical protein